MTTLSPVRRSLYPEADDTWETLAARALPEQSATEAVSQLQSWNLHVFMRPAAPAGSPREGQTLLPSDIIFIEPPLAR